jgi:molecular chaperone DnaK (HSP70)
MNRRDLLKMIAAATGMAVVAGDLLAQGLTVSDKVAVEALFSKADISLLDEVAETILPRTDTPGAKDSGAGAQMAAIISNCFDQSQRTLVKDGLLALQALCLHRFKQNFQALTAEQKHQILTELDTEAKTLLTKAQQNNVAPQPHYFTVLKQQSIFAFFTSKVGATEVLRHVAIPGRWDGDYPYKKGDRAWFL